MVEEFFDDSVVQRSGLKTFSVLFMISRSWIQTPVIDQISGYITIGFCACFSAHLARDSSHAVRLWTDT